MRVKPGRVVLLDYMVRVESGRRALELARRTNPDALLLDDSLPDIGAVDVCRALRDDPLFNRATPIFITAIFSRFPTAGSRPSILASWVASIGERACGWPRSSTA